MDFRSDKYQVLLYEVEAPLLQRFARYQTKYKTIGLEEFVVIDDVVSISIKAMWWRDMVTLAKVAFELPSFWQGDEHRED